MVPLIIKAIILYILVLLVDAEETKKVMLNKSFSFGNHSFSFK